LSRLKIQPDDFYDLVPIHCYFISSQIVEYRIILTFLSAFTTTNVTLIAAIAHHLLTLARDMRTHGCQPLRSSSTPGKKKPG